jgi:nicotinamidase-related amidase
VRATGLIIGSECAAPVSPNPEITVSQFPTFKPSDSALLLIDHQVGTMKLIKNLPLERVKANTLALAKTAEVFALPTVLTSSQEEMFQGPLLSELNELLPAEFAARVKRAGIVNAWDDPKFVAAVKATGRKNLIMAGVTTDVCVVFPAISAVRAGYNVQVVLDAGGSPYVLSEDTSRWRMQNEGVVLTATNTMMAELAQDWSTPHGEQLKGVLFGEVLPPVA